MASINSNEVAKYKYEDNEITKYNYEDGIAEVMELMKLGDFVAVDATIETTGFVLPDENFNPAYMKDMSNCFGEWFDTIKTEEKTRCLLDVGIAIFKRVPDQSKELEVECFHIPVLPACVDDNEFTRFRGTSCVRLKFDGYAREWVQSVNFDVNRPFYVGAPYMNREQRELGDKYMKENPEFMVAPRKRRLASELMPVLYETVSEEERQLILARLKGVSKIFEAMSVTQVPVVGHHLLLKLIFIFKDFIEYLPDTFPECLDRIKGIFPLVYDTKQMAKILRNLPGIPIYYQNRLRDIRLYELLRNLNLGCNVSKFVATVGERSKHYKEDVEEICLGELLEEDSQSFCHVAGFDAFVSGLVFLDLISLIQMTNVAYGLQTTNDDLKDTLAMFVKGHATRFRNKLYGEPNIPPVNSALFLKSTEEKKSMRRKLEEDEKAQRQRAKKQIDISQAQYIVRDWPPPSNEPREIPG